MVETLTLYERIGGKAALQTVVADFYRRVLGDASLAPLFQGTDMKRQQGHMMAFLAVALGGPDAYRGKDMTSAHAGRGITEEHFASVAGHLQSTLQDAGVAAPDVATILATAASLQPQVVGV